MRILVALLSEKRIAEIFLKNNERRQTVLAWGQHHWREVGQIQPCHLCGKDQIHYLEMMLFWSRFDTRGIPNIFLGAAFALHSCALGSFNLDPAHRRTTQLSMNFIFHISFSLFTTTIRDLIYCFIWAASQMSWSPWILRQSARRSSWEFKIFQAVSVICFWHSLVYFQ